MARTGAAAGSQERLAYAPSVVNNFDVAGEAVHQQNAVKWGDGRGQRHARKRLGQSLPNVPSLWIVQYVQPTQISDDLGRGI